MGRDWQVESGTEEKRKWELGDKGGEMEQKSGNC